MGRSRSRSPRRDRRRRSRSRSRSRDKERTRDQDRRRHEVNKSRSPRSSRRSPRHQRSRKRSRSRSQSNDDVVYLSRSNDDVVYTGTSHISECSPKPKKAKPVVEPQNGTETNANPEETEMMKLMGFAGFNSTKGKKVEGKDVSAVNVVQKRKYRQYMNRRGGFNRPLDFVA